MKTFELRVVRGRSNPSGGEYRETVAEFVDAAYPTSAENKLRKRIEAKGWRLVSVTRNRELKR